MLRLNRNGTYGVVSTMDEIVHKKHLHSQCFSKVSEEQEPPYATDEVSWPSNASENLSCHAVAAGRGS